MQGHTRLEAEFCRLHRTADLVDVKQRRCQHPAGECASCVPSPTLSPTDPVPRGLLTLCPAASSGPQGQ